MFTEYIKDIKKKLFVLFIPVLYLLMISLPVSNISNSSFSNIMKIIIFIVFMISLVYFFINCSHYLLFKKSLNYYNTNIFKEIITYYAKVVFLYVFMTLLFFLTYYLFGSDNTKEVIEKQDDILNLTLLLNLNKYINEIRFFINSLNSAMTTILLVLMLSLFNLSFYKNENERLYIIYNIFKKENKKVIDEKVKKSYYNKMKADYSFKIYLVTLFLIINFESVPYFSIIKIFVSYFVIIGLELFMWYMSWKIYEDVEGYKTKKKEKKKAHELVIDFGISKAD